MKTFKEHTNSTLYFTFGRFDPPHQGHSHLFNILTSEAAKNNSDCLIFISRTTDLRKTFLSVNDRIKFLKQLNPLYAHLFVDNPEIKNVIDVMDNYKYNKYILIVGVPDVEYMERFKRYVPKNSTLEIPLLPELKRNKINNISSSKLKNFIVNDEKDKFLNGISNNEVGEEMYNLLLPYKSKLEKYVIAKNR